MDEKIRVDCSGEKEVGGRRRFRVLLVLTLVYVASLSLSAFMYLPKLFNRNEWSELGVNAFLWRLAISLFAWIWSVVLICILVRMHRGRRLLGREMNLGMYLTGAGLSKRGGGDDINTGGTGYELYRRKRNTGKCSEEKMQ